MYLNARPRDRLKALCKQGRLFEAERFLEEAGTARLRKTRKWSPLFVAVDRGFHSLVEVLVRYDHAQWDLEKSCRAAFSRRRPDLAGLIMRSEAWTEPVDLTEALATGDVILARSLMEAGVDLTRGDSILKAAARNAKGVLEIVEQLDLPMEKIEGQLHSAMVTHAYLGRVPSVMRLLRAGLDPHRVVLHLDEHGDPFDEGSAVSVSMHTGKPGFFAALRPDPLKDSEEDLIRTAVFLGEEKMLKILLEAGFTLNCKANGGSPALDQVLKAGTLELTGLRLVKVREGEQGRFRDEALRLISAVEDLVEQGARWVPDTDDRGEMRWVRDALLAIGESHALTLFDILEKSGAASSEHIDFLLRTPRMKSLARAVRDRR